MSDALPQHNYQVRFEWGVAGFHALAGHSDVIVLVDALPTVEWEPGTVLGGHGTPVSFEQHRVVASDFRNRTAVARWVLDRQAEKGDRFSVAVIAVGEPRAGGSIRMAVEDLLAAGAVVDALSSHGIDHCSPEAAAASAAFVGLKRALRHVLSGSESGQALHAAGLTNHVKTGSVLDDVSDVVEIREFPFPG